MDIQNICLICQDPLSEVSSMHASNNPECILHIVCGTCKDGLLRATPRNQRPKCPYDRRKIYDWIEIDREMIFPNILAPDPQPEPDIGGAIRRRWQCYHCHRDFASRGARGNHARVSHGTGGIAPKKKD